MRFYENTSKTSENRLPPRAYYIPSGVSKCLCLNGEWDFKYYERDIDIEDEIEFTDKTEVPSCWQSLGYGNPNYANINYPYPCDPPYVPDDNPCGVYERDFNLSDIIGRVYLVLEGVSSCAEIYINGRYVGFTEGSHLEAEFDITEYAKKGENRIRITVRKWCCGSYLEDQDCFRFNGIFRDLYILNRPDDHIVDYTVNYNSGSLKINLDKEAEIELISPNGEKIFSGTDKSFDIKVAHPVLWNAEKPKQYRLNIKRNGEIIPTSVALCTVGVSNKGELLINGTPIKLHGVNHHDTSPVLGWCMTKDEIEKDLLLMKELNINCIRTSHYPPTPYLIELAEKLGFYIILENDLETHGFLRRLPDKPYRFDVEDELWPVSSKVWEGELLDRMKRTVGSYKNFGSVIMWSLGNESGYGVNSEKMTDWLRTLNDGRLIHCEDASRKGDNSRVDVVSMMYSDFKYITDYAESDEIKPFLLCEYAHAMGNGPGDIYYYNEIFDKYPKLIGGCVWEWTDHTVIVDGVKCYGGDFKDELTTDGNFCCDGMTFSDRTLKAGSYEVKAAYQPIRTSLDGSCLKITNRLDFTDLKEYDLSITFALDGKEIERKVVPLCLAPHESTEIILDLPKESVNIGGFVITELSKDGRIFARTSHEFLKPKEQIKDTDLLLPEEDKFNLYYKGENFCYTFSKHYGTFTSIKINGEEKLASKISLTAFRPLTDNDKRMAAYWDNSTTWQGENLNVLCHKVYSCHCKDGKITVNSAIGGVSLLPLMRYTLEITVSGNGKIEISLDGKIREDAVWIPRLGFEMSLYEKPNSEFSYFAYGPTESYLDMHFGSVPGLYKSTAEKEVVPYIRPQEMGNHYDARMLNIGGMKISGGGFEFSCLPYSTESIHSATHTNELTSDGLTHLRIDYKQSGVGSASCGPDLDPAFRLSEKDIHFTISAELV